MDSSYDEILTENTFFQVLQQDYRDVFLKAIVEGCVIAVPRAGSLPKYMLTLEDFLNHILIPSEELPESHFHSLNGKDVKICNKVITVEHEIGLQSSTHILFEETFYTEDYIKYKVLCLEKPLDDKSDLSSSIVVLKTLRDCMDFLWIECGNQNVIEKIDEAVNSYLVQNVNRTRDIETVRDSTALLFNKCLQIVLRDSKIKEKASSHKYIFDNLRIAVESYVHHGIYNKLIKDISTCTANEDARLNKIIRNLSDIQLRDLDIKNELYEVLPRAKFELSRIDRYSTVFGKINCLKKTFAAISKKPGNVVTTDDLLPVLVFLVIKTNLPNWNAQLKYLKYFRFSTSSDFQSDENGFLVATLEAAIEHIQSGVLATSLIPKGQETSLNNNINDCDFEKIPLRLVIKEALYDTKKISTLFQKIKLGDLDAVKKILKNNEVETINISSLNLCHPLCTCQNCKSLLSNKLNETAPSIKSCDDQDLTPLHIAAMYGRPKIVDFLLSNGANRNAPDCNGTTPIHYAAMRGHQNALLLLAHAGANVNACDNCSNTPLHFCSNNGHESCVKALIYFCEHVGMKLNINAQNSSGDTPLHSAARWGYVNIVKILLENHADPTILNKRKMTPIDYAHNTTVLQWLTSNFGKKEIENYVRIKIKAPSLDFTEEQTEELKDKNIIQGVRPHSTEIIKKVEKVLKAIACGDINLTCFYLGIDMEDLKSNSVIVCPQEENQIEKCHPLCTCSKCSTDQTEVVTNGYIKDRNSLNINVCNSDGYTPLHTAAMHGRIELVKVFIQKGAYLNVQTRSKLLTPLMLACQNQRLQVVKELLQSGASIDVQDYKGNTALHHACHTGNNRLVEILIKYEPNINLKNLRNRTALDEAKEKMSLSLVKIIKGGKSMNLNGL